jgi:acyl dehydratase
MASLFGNTTDWHVLDGFLRGDANDRRDRLTRKEALRMPQATDDFRVRARLVPKGHTYDDFAIGRVFHHHWGRTITESESTLFSTLTLHFNPHYYNAAYAKAHGHPGLVANPMLVFTTVFGLSVEDLSEGGGPFLGVNELTFHQPVYPGDTLRAQSTVLDKRVSDSMKDFGIATWHTEGFNQNDERVIDFKRTNLVRLRRAP